MNKRDWLQFPATVLLAIATDCAAGGADASATSARSYPIDASSARVEFDIAALWILRRRGRFDDIDGSLEISADGLSAEIDVRIGVDSVRMKDRDHVELLLSPAFFDATHHPWIEFRSDAFALSDQSRVGLPGTLTVRGISRRVHFNVDLRDCRGGLPDACTVLVDGVLERSRFGMTEYRRTLADKVHLAIEVKLAGSAPP